MTKINRKNGIEMSFEQLIHTGRKPSQATRFYENKTLAKDGEQRRSDQGGRDSEMCQFSPL